ENAQGLHIAADLHQLAVEFAVELERGVEVAALHRCGIIPGDVRQHVQLGRRHGLDAAAYGEDAQLGVELEQVLDELPVELADGGAPVGGDLDQAFALERAQGLAYRHGAEI